MITEKTSEFRCSECHKLLAKVLEDGFQAKCPRCGMMNVHKAEINYDADTNVITISGGAASMWDVITYMAGRDVDFAAMKERMDKEALEAHNEVSRHGDNLRRD